ncbi:MAG: RNA polymerase sigma factor region1.1 domain-containing protein [Anaerolineales bacterium]
MIQKNLLEADEETGQPFFAVQQLVVLGRQKGYVTLDDLLQFFPEAEEEINQLDEVFAALMSAGVPYVEDGGQAQEGSTTELGDETPNRLIRLSQPMTTPL